MKVGQRFLDLGTDAEQIGTASINGETAARKLVGNTAEAFEGQKQLNVPPQTPIKQTAVSDAVPLFGLKNDSRCIAYPVYETYTVADADLTTGGITLKSGVAPGQDASVEIVDMPGATALANGIDFGVEGDLLKWAGFDMAGRVVAGDVITVKYNSCRPDQELPILERLWAWSQDIFSEADSGMVVTLTRAIDGTTVDITLPTITGAGTVRLLMAAGELWLCAEANGTYLLYDREADNWIQAITGAKVGIAYPMGEQYIGVVSNVSPGGVIRCDLYDKTGAFVESQTSGVQLPSTLFQHWGGDVDCTNYPPNLVKGKVIAWHSFYQYNNAPDDPTMKKGPECVGERDFANVPRDPAYDTQPIIRSGEASGFIPVADGKGITQNLGMGDSMGSTIFPTSDAYLFNVDVWNRGMENNPLYQKIV